MSTKDQAELLARLGEPEFRKYFRLGREEYDDFSEPSYRLRQKHPEVFMAIGDNGEWFSPGGELEAYEIGRKIEEEYRIGKLT